MRTRTTIRIAAIGMIACFLAVKLNAQVLDPGKDEHIESNVKKFLNVLNSGEENPWSK